MKKTLVSKTKLKLHLPYLDNKDKFRLKEYLIKCVGDLTSIKFNMHVDKLDLDEDNLRKFISANKKYFQSTLDKIEKLKLKEAEKKLFELVQSGNMKAIELYLKRSDEKSSSKSPVWELDKDSKEMLDEVLGNNKVESSREINDKRDENECQEK